ncbi:hypothetical protein [Rhizobium leguminosarum]|uniref:hypothetical protein n=1 Tax=Rhizobium leguminosarum TaxID=384 RepID=UPI000FEC5902|nr:hypothetical protein [Rhizobium leguminosarum]MBY2917507.1 hypothetical protein [Rhizobium leguminosarum]MBY2974235.1 hypothetical protein [Rhizobium leguminosarum]MBY2981635.1 hypothetical protein [Rhizobium leguminosarum]MBY3003093.1 hypothetical protein [Rhizobium leguminosarum]MBY3010184.1 hypothetical protein [Rhizobium leguminosarum]
MLDLSFPWPIGPIPIAMTVWASYGLYRAVVTRDGVTWASVVSVLGLVAFMAALTAQVVKPVINQALALMIAQFLGTGACFLFVKLLWSVQKTKPEPSVPSLRRPDVKMLRGMGICLSFLIVLDGLFFLFPDAGKCAHFKGYMANKCAGKELFIGIHDLPVEIYFGVVLGVPAMAGLILGIWALFRTAGLPDADEPGTKKVPAVDVRQNTEGLA